MTVSEKSGGISRDQFEASLEKHKTLVIDVRLRHRASDKVLRVSWTWFLSPCRKQFHVTSSVASRLHVLLLVVDCPQLRLPKVEIDTSDSALSDVTVRSAVKYVQRYVSSPTSN